MNALPFATVFPLTEPVSVIATVLLVILIAPLLARWMRMPGVVAIIIAGALIGPHALGVLDRDPVIVLLGTFGLLYLMFTAGLSMDLHQFAQTRQRSVTFGLLSFFIPQVAGIIIGMNLLGYDWPTAILLGSIVGSHTLLAYPIIKRLGITRNRAVTTTLGGTIFTDGLALALLAIVVASVEGDLTVAFWLRFTGMVMLVVMLVVIVLPIIGRWFFRSVGGAGDVEFGFLLVVLGVSAAASEYIGLAPIVGAFLAGLTMNRLVPDTGPLMNRVHFVGDALVIPFFLLSVGMLVDPRALVTSLDVWFVALTFILLIVIGKSIAAWLMRPIFGYSNSEVGTVIGLTIPQAAATLAVTLIAHEFELFSSLEVNAVVITILATTLAGSWMTQASGKRVALDDAGTLAPPGQSPLRILIPLANPSSAPALMDAAFMIRREDSTEPVYPLTVANETSDIETQVAASERMLGYAVTHAAGAGVPVIPATRVDTNIAAGITRAIRELAISTVVIGWSGSPPGSATSGRRILGSVLDRVLASNPQSVLICRFVEPINTTERVLLIIPPHIDREPGFTESIRIARLMASRLGAKLLIFARQEEVNRVRNEINRVKPNVPTEFIACTFDDSEDANLMRLLRKSAGAHDMLMLLSTREGRVAWSPQLNRMPRRLVDSHDEHNLIVQYPSEQMRDPSWSVRADAHAAGNLVRPERIALGVRSRSLDAILHELFTATLDLNREDLTNVLQSLKESAEEYSTELAPEIALLHAHVEQMQEPLVYFITCDGGLALPRIETPVRVLVVLLSPRDLPPQEHLRILADLAHMIQPPDILDRVSSVTTYEGLIAVLSESREVGKEAEGQ